MRKDIRIAGSGGQGVIVMAMLMANAYGLFEGLEIAQTQSYGAAARGGACQASLVVSDKPIGFIEVDNADILVAFNEVSFKTFITRINPNAVIFVDSTYISKDKYEDLPNAVYALDVTNIAEHQFKPFMANVIMLGFVAAILKDVDIRSIESAIKERLPGKMQEMNLAALRYGYERGSA